MEKLLQCPREELGIHCSGPSTSMIDFETHIPSIYEGWGGSVAALHVDTSYSFSLGLHEQMSELQTHLTCLFCARLPNMVSYMSSWKDLRAASDMTGQVTDY